MQLNIVNNRIIRQLAIFGYDKYSIIQYYNKLNNKYNPDAKFILMNDDYVLPNRITLYEYYNNDNVVQKMLKMNKEKNLICDYLRLKLMHDFHYTTFLDADMLIYLNKPNNIWPFDAVVVYPPFAKPYWSENSACCMVMHMGTNNFDDSMFNGWLNYITNNVEDYIGDYQLRVPINMVNNILKCDLSLGYWGGNPDLLMRCHNRDNPLYIINNNFDKLRNFDKYHTKVLYVPEVTKEIFLECVNIGAIVIDNIDYISEFLTNYELV